MGDKVTVLRKGEVVQGEVIKRDGSRVRVAADDGSSTCWIDLKDIKEWRPAVGDAPRPIADARSTTATAMTDVGKVTAGMQELQLKGPDDVALLRLCSLDAEGNLLVRIRMVWCPPTRA